jgi:hypothetical protein
MPYRANYPRTVAEILDDRMTYKPECLRALRAFRRAKPWRGTVAERIGKLMALHVQLCEVYGVHVDLRFGKINGSSSGGSSYHPLSNVIILRGRLSVVTYLHEFGHARDYDERQACRWSINLFRRTFPRSFARCRTEGHVLISDRRD